MKDNKKEEKHYEIGVIIGRFQLHELHFAHKDLIDTVVKQHKKIILFLGVSPVLGTIRNPLDFTSRKKMIQEEYPDINIIALPDQRSDKNWSKMIDTRVREVYQIGNVMLYGGRDSFIPHYKGSFDTKELEQDVYISGTEIRKQASEDIKSSSLWRAGAIYQTYNRYPVSFQTVDIAPMDNNKLLLCQKPGENLYRFIGGFSDPKDRSLEEAAKREFTEESGGAEIGDLQYIGSFRVNDWRYKNEVDKIMTALFYGKYIFGALTPSDDISILKWINIDQFNQSFIDNEMVDEHKELAESLIKWLNKKQ